MYLCVRGIVMYLCVRGIVMYLCVRGIVMYLCVSGIVMYLCVRGIVMYLCVRGIEFASFYNFFDQFLEMFRQCDIFVFHFISLYWNRCHCKYSF